MIKRFAKRALKWLGTIKIVNNIIIRTIGYNYGAVLYYKDSKRASVFDLILQIKNETGTLTGDVAAYQIFMAVKQTEKIKGDIAEVGVYKGGSAKLICEAKGDRPLHLFDTFEGLPELSKEDSEDRYKKGQYAASFEGAKNYLMKYPNVFFYKGLFPSTANPIKDKNFSFVNLDVDLYRPTLDSLEFFYSRMNKGAIIISHDYISPTGVRKAFDEFFKDKPEPVIELAGGQGMVVKI